MKNNLRFAFAFITLLAAMLACANPLSGTAPATANVETVVAATLDALTAYAPAPEVSATPLPLTVSLLPHSMYFINNDSAGLAQVYRLDQAGVTVTQLTFEPANVDDYDVSMLDGSVVYVSNNQLLTIHADGSSRSTIFDGDSVNSPVWSPNGETIAFAYKGLNFYSVVSGQSNRVLDDQID
ncbi:MAG: hypothetical protein Q8O48_02455, partial [Anaerolineales bacterium]|nr:hypothetical protein [Anaerolineales bacterium]